MTTSKSLSVLICSAGRRVGLLSSFRTSLRDLGLEGRVIACDLDPGMSAACAAADAAFTVPRATDPGYAAAILDIARAERVGLIVPAIDPELLPLAQAAPEFAAAGIRVHVSAPPVIDVVRDKSETARVLDAAGVPVPRTLTEAQLRATPDGLRWPVFAKPSGGSASRGLAVFDHIDALPDSFDEPMIFQDRLTGPEYTINMFVDAEGALRCVVPHKRLSVRAGEVEKGRTERRKDLHEIAAGILRALPDLRGVACFQVIEDPEIGIAVFEINARFGGGYPLAEYAGASFARWLLEEVADLPRSADNAWRDGAEMLRYDDAIYRG